MRKSVFHILTLVLALTVFAPSFATCAQTPGSDVFDSKRYADEYPDLRLAFGYNHEALWNHYLTYGRNENRTVYTTDGVRTVFAPAAPAQSNALTEANFDSRRYADDYPDLKRAFCYDHAALWNHYLTYGKREGRIVYNRAGIRAAVDDSALLPAAPTKEQQFAAAMLALINAERAAYGAATLTLADDCTAAARVRGADFQQYLKSGAAVTSLPHIRPDGSLFTTAYKCCKGTRYGENTRFSYYFADDDVVSFANRTFLSMRESSDQYMRMINPKYRYAGFTLTHLADEGQSSWYVTLSEFRD